MIDEEKYAISARLENVSESGIRHILYRERKRKKKKSFPTVTKFLFFLFYVH